MEHSEEIQVRIDRMVEIKRRQESLKTEWAELEAFFLKRGGDDLADTKRKSVTYFSDGGKVTATIAETVKVVWPAFLKAVFGDAYKDAVTEKTTYKLSDPAARMLGGLWSNNYTKMTVAEVLEHLPAEDVAKKLLVKKLKGARYDTDKKNLMVIGGLEEDMAEHYAYFVAEAAIWEDFCRLLQVNQIQGQAAIEEILKLISGAVVVEETPKITLEYMDTE